VIIVSGEFVVEPDQVDAFLAGRREVMQISRAEQGCHDYVFSADPLVPGRVVLFERWEDQESLNAHLAGLRSRRPAEGPAVAVKSSSITLYDVAGERKFA
jgi:quinol monooxygenase YgiN